MTEMKNAQEITDRIRELLESSDLGAQEAGELYDLIAESRARIEISDEENIDLLKYSDPRKIEQERRDLDLALAEAEVRLEEASLDESLDFGESFQRFINSYKEDIFSELAQNDAEFKKYRIRESVKSGVKAAVIGIAAGEVMREAIGFGSDLIHDEIGTGAIGRTPVQALIEHFRGEGPKMNPDSWHQEVLGSHGAVKLPDGVDVIQNPDGGTTIYDSIEGKNIVDSLSYNSDGSLTQESIDQLHSSGIDISDNVHQIVEDHTRQVTYNAHDAIQSDPNFHQVSRDLWFDNDTQMYMGADGNMYGADFNELGLSYRLVSDGNIVVDVSHMTPDGSWHDGLSADYQQDIAEGKMKLNFSMNEETQRYVDSVKITGEHTVIPKGSDEYNNFFEVQNGEVVQTARFAEVSEVIGQRDGHDVVRMLATAEGDGIDHYTSTIIDRVTVDAHEYVMDIPRETYIEPPPFIPIFGRNSLESARARGAESVHNLGAGKNPPEGSAIDRQPGTRTENPGEEEKTSGGTSLEQGGDDSQEEKPEVTEEDFKAIHEYTNFRELFNQAKEFLLGSYVFHQGVDLKIKSQYIKNHFKIGDEDAKGLVHLLIQDGVLSKLDEHGNMKVTPPNGYEKGRNSTTVKEREATVKLNFKRVRKEILKRYTDSEKIGIEDIKNMLDTDDEILVRRIAYLLIHSDTKLLSEIDENGMMTVMKEAQVKPSEKGNDTETKKFPKITLHEALEEIGRASCRERV